MVFAGNAEIAMYPCNANKISLSIRLPSGHTMRMVAGYKRADVIHVSVAVVVAAVVVNSSASGCACMTFGPTVLCLFHRTDLRRGSNLVRVYLLVTLFFIFLGAHGGGGGGKSIREGTHTRNFTHSCKLE